MWPFYNSLQIRTHSPLPSELVTYQTWACIMLGKQWSAAFLQVSERRSRRPAGEAAAGNASSPGVQLEGTQMSPLLWSPAQNVFPPIHWLIHPIITHCSTQPGRSSQGCCGNRHNQSVQSPAYRCCEAWNENCGWNHLFCYVFVLCVSGGWGRVNNSNKNGLFV